MHEYIHSQLRAKVVPPFDCAHFAKIISRDTVIASELERLKRKKKERTRSF